jgi:hypothetical protein
LIARWPAHLGRCGTEGRPVTEIRQIQPAQPFHKE